MASMIENLLKTPEQVRQEQLAKLQQQGLQQAQLMTAGQTPFANWGAGQIARMPEAMDRAVRMGGQAAGSLARAAGAAPETVGMLRGIGVSPEERRAQEMQQKLAGAKGDYQGLMALGQELLQSGNAQDAYAVLQLAKELEPEAEDSVNILDTNDNKNIAAIAKYEMQCDINDPKCFAEARKRWIDQKRENAKELVGYKGLVKKREEMIKAVESINQSNNALAVLNSGDVNIGAFPNTRQGVMKLMATVFPRWEKANQTVANTDLLISQTKLLAGQLLSTGMFGDGTAISERDLATAERIAGASETLTPLAMKEILEFNAKVQQKKIQGFNQSLNRYNPEFFARTIEGSAENFMVTIPPVRSASNVGKPKEPETEQVIYNDMMFTIPKGAQAGKIKGRLVYKKDGKYYDMNTGELVE